MRDGYMDVWIEVDGLRLREYTPLPPIRSGVHTECRCWVPSQAGKRFSIRWRDFSPKRAIWIRCFIDGIPVGPHGRYSKNPPSCQEPPDSLDGWLVSNTVRKSFEFTNLHVTEDAPESAKPELGTIKVCFFQVKGSKIPETTTNVAFADLAPVLSGHSAHTKVVARQLHGVQPGAEMNIEELQGLEAVTPGSKPFLTVKFHYRPMEILRANGVVEPLVVIDDDETVPANSGRVTRQRARPQRHVSHTDSHPYSVRERRGREVKSQMHNQSRRIIHSQEPLNLQHPNFRRRRLTSESLEYVNEADVQPDRRVVAESRITRMPTLKAESPVTTDPTHCPLSRKRVKPLDDDDHAVAVPMATTTPKNSLQRRRVMLQSPSREFSHGSDIATIIEELRVEKEKVEQAMGKISMLEQAVLQLSGDKNRRG
ncbi:hypothetical protein JAAARDRAFT_40939 [Jaapia argillacea MUCL 33604]|uniref:DUF7918 domain-containing protein n=1 Tax=Jaapia argillacea MUCL 33604 TaxID=933084 RepID=A0A067PKY2_9AGAM|nr:hypothetical protein JAAARDRAFT_40939 [Jaapia argillacea MUCL 33604]